MGDVFLYLLGAGASCQVLPLASQFKERLPLFAKDLKSAGPQGARLPSDDPVWGANRDNLLRAIEWLAEESSHHFSVDTFAKKLFFLGDHQNLQKLKAALSAYLVIEQSRNHVDQRYDAFFASVLKPGEYRANIKTLTSSLRVSLPEHLRIFTWNYDTQLEKAYYGFCREEDNVIEDITFSESIYRINGHCGTITPGHIGDSFRAVWNTANKPAWEEGIKLYNESLSTVSEISFAWEDRTNTILKNKGLIRLTGISDLVVIGYSFPYFNREIDRLIFEKIDPDLRRVYLQYPTGVHTSIKERLKNLIPTYDKLEIIQISSTNNDLFFIPDNF
ncbi:MAG: hypothetical protein ABSF20_00600 [Smithella sp.]